MRHAHHVAVGCGVTGASGVVIRQRGTTGGLGGTGFVRFVRCRGPRIDVTRSPTALFADNRQQVRRLGLPVVGAEEVRQTVLGGGTGWMRTDAPVEFLGVVSPPCG